MSKSQTFYRPSLLDTAAEAADTLYPRREGDALGRSVPENSPHGPFVNFMLNGRAARAEAGVSVAAAVLANGVTEFRRSLSGEARGPLCGMGICYECRVTIDGRPHRKSCQITLQPDMVVRTDE